MKKNHPASIKVGIDWVSLWVEVSDQLQAVGQTHMEKLKMDWGVLDQARLKEQAAYLTGNNTCSCCLFC